MKNKCPRAIMVMGTVVILAGLALLFGGSDVALILGGQKVLDATSITAIALLLLALIGIKLSKE